VTAVTAPDQLLLIGGRRVPGRRSGTGRLGGRHAAEAVTEIQSISTSLSRDWR
jgi:hypothetical protein